MWASDNNDDDGWPFQTLVCVGRSQLGWGTQQVDETSEPVLTAGYHCHGEDEDEDDEHRDDECDDVDGKSTWI